MRKVRVILDNKIYDPIEMGPFNENNDFKNILTCRFNGLDYRLKSTSTYHELPDEILVFSFVRCSTDEADTLKNAMHRAQIATLLAPLSPNTVIKTAEKFVRNFLALQIGSQLGSQLINFQKLKLQSDSYFPINIGDKSLTPRSLLLNDQETYQLLSALGDGTKTEQQRIDKVLKIFENNSMIAKLILENFAQIAFSFLPVSLIHGFVHFLNSHNFNDSIGKMSEFLNTVPLELRQLVNLNDPAGVLLITPKKTHAPEVDQIGSALPFSHSELLKPQPNAKGVWYIPFC